MSFWSDDSRTTSICATPSGSVFATAPFTYTATGGDAERFSSENARAILRVAEDTQRLAWPEEAALRAADLSIISSLASELNDPERRVFAVTGDGMRYRAIATRLDISVNEARRACRSFERKRQRFQVLYDAGRAGTENGPPDAHRPSDSEQPA